MRVTYGEENSSPSYGDQASGFHTDTSDILQAIHSVRVDMTSQFETVLSAVQDVKNQVTECFGRLTQTEERISQTEDSITTQIDDQHSRKEKSTLQSMTSTLEKKVAVLTWKIDDLENHSRRSNLRLVGLPEKSEGSDACAFLESWLPVALDMEPLQKPLAIERAYRIGSMRRSDTDKN